MSHPENFVQDTASRLETLERKNRRLTAAVAVTVLAAAAVAAAQFTTVARAGERGSSGTADSILTVRQIVVEDANGVVRARLGSDLPNAVRDGKRISRGRSDSKIAGLLLYDKTGAERGVSACEAEGRGRPPSPALSRSPGSFGALSVSVPLVAGAR